VSYPLRVPAILLLVILGLLALGWVYGAATNWEAISSRPVRLAYIIADFGLVIPIGVAAAIGLLRGARWGGPLFALALGLLLFDIAHGVLYLIWDNYFGIPIPAGFGLLAVTLVYTWYGIRSLLRTAPRP
jgi:hypothetical protein